MGREAAPIRLSWTSIFVGWSHADRAVRPLAGRRPAYDDSKLIELGRDLKASGGMKIPVIVLVQPDGIAHNKAGGSRGLISR